MQASAFMFQAVIHFITGDAFEQGAKVSFCESINFLRFCSTSVSLSSIKCFTCLNAHYTALL